MSARQRQFLIAYISTGSIAVSRKQLAIQASTWGKWASDEHFQAMFKIIKSPVAFASNLKQAIILRAAQEHLKLFNNERTAVVQWAIERAYALPGARGSHEEERPLLTQADVKKLAETLGDELNSTDRQRLTMGPFAPIDVEPTVIQETVIDG